MDPIPRTDSANRTRELLIAPRNKWQQILYFLGMHQLLASDSPDAPDATLVTQKMHWQNVTLKARTGTATHLCKSDGTLV